MLQSMSHSEKSNHINSDMDNNVFRFISVNSKEDCGESRQLQYKLIHLIIQLIKCTNEGLC